jgi:hypothetical protein
VKPTKDIFRLALQHAKRVIHSGHDLIPAAFLYGDDYCIALPLQGDNERINLALRMFTHDMVLAGLAMDEITGVDTVGEVWTADVSASDIERGQMVRAATHPNRRACVLICAWGAEGRRTVTYEVIQRNAERKVGEPVHVDKELETWLDPLFVKRPTLPKNTIMRAALIATYQRLALLARRGESEAIVNFALGVADSTKRLF